jgi:hypothetical protein
MASYVWYTTIDSHDAYAQSTWWSAVLNYAEDPDDPNAPDHDECAIRSPDGSHKILFINVPEPKTVKNRVHFDIRPADGARDGEVARLVGLGATQLADHRKPDGSGWVVLADPEGNEFCVLRSESEVAAQRAAVA